MTIIEQIRTEIKRLEGIDYPCDTHEEATGFYNALDRIASFLDTLQEQPEMDLKKFTEKMDSWKARFSRPDDIPIKATMAFTARMFFMYPNVARQWYDSLPKATQD